MDNYNKFLEFREKYPQFIYEKYEVQEDNEFLYIKYYFNIPNLTYFYPQLKINKKDFTNKDISKEFVDYLIFHIGLIELISYYKCTCSPKIVVKAGYLTFEQMKWFKKLYYNGLGELLYRNNIKTTEDGLFDMICDCEETIMKCPNYSGDGNLICVGGGKDSCVSLEILKNEENNTCFIMNPKTPALKSCQVAGYHDEETVRVERFLDRKIVELNNQGFLNGHTPLSSLLAFLAYFVGYLRNKKYIVLSNESSANEASVIGTKINHQYSKTFEFENDFNNYIKMYFKIDLTYFSLLRGLSEFQIGHLFSKYEKYHGIFKSCNLGSKEKEWKWCCNCSKCLFVYMILSPFLYKEKLVEIFGEDMFERQDLLKTFIEILGYAETKPFECVGTYGEARYAVSLLIDRLDKNSLPFLLKYYYDNYDLNLDGTEILKYNEENNVNPYFEKLVKEAMSEYV